MSERIEKIEKLDKSVVEIDQIDQFGQADREQPMRVEPNKEYFERLMVEGTSTQRPEHDLSEAVKKITPMEAATPTSRTSSRIPSTQEIIAQANDAAQRMESIKYKLATPGLELPKNEVHSLKNKLSHIQDSINVALGKVGLDYTPPDAPKGLISPLQKFIGYMTHGQHQLESLSTEINSLAIQKEQLDPGKMLAIQAKMGFINGELEFFASALNKTLESFKTIMNVQV